MAGSKSDAYEVDLLKAATGQATTVLTTTPITPYVALFTSPAGTPTDASSFVEATGGGYARISSASKWGTPSAGAVTNSAEIAFAAFSGSVSAGAAFVAFGIYNHVSAGTLMYWGELTDETKTGGAGDTIRFPIGSLTLTED